ncbi:hypothetical protein RI864_003077 [Salmonella enterica]|nr:hypothetical protein [Salmonella enterica]
MPSLNVKQEKNQSFAGYSLPPANSHEIDLFSLIEVLWQAKRRILATVFAFACVGLLLSFLLPQKWTSQAIVTPAESVQWQGLERTLTALRVLDMEVSVDRASVFNLFIKKFSSPSLLEEYLRSSPYVMDQLKGAQDGDLRNRQYHVEQLAAMNVSDVKFTPFKYQLSPSLPVKKDGPGKAVIIILAALIGGMMACGGVLLRHAMVSRKMENALAIDERLV